MKLIKIYIIALFIILLAGRNVFAQYENPNFSVSFNYSYTTSSKLYLFPNAQDLILRNQFVEMDGARSFGIDLRYKISEPLLIGISSEILKNTTSHREFSVGGFIIDVEDGFELIPIELSLYYRIPFSSEKFNFYMGGGVGFYIGRQVRNFSDVSVTDVGNEIFYGIQVSTGMDYVVNSFISIRTELRFRDPEFDMKSKYSKQVFDFNGRTLLLSKETFETKANVDGITFMIGIVLRPF